MSARRLYDPRWFDPLRRRTPITIRFETLPVEELFVLADLATQHPGLQFNLRKQRGVGKKYFLTILPLHHEDKEVAKGET